MIINIFKYAAISILMGSIFYAQFKPESFTFENTKLPKTNAATPASNSILDIIVKGDTIWLGTTRGLSRSFDGGATWRNYYNDGIFGDESITAIAYDRGLIAAATGKTVERDGQDLPAGTGLKISLDHGETWSSVPQSLDDTGDSLITYGINRIRALPVTTEINNITYDVALTPNTIWIATFAGGLRKSTDMGQTWNRVVLPPDYLSSIKPTDTLSFSLQPVAGRFGNESYLNHRVFSVVSADDTTLYVGSANGINKTTDSGLSWEKFNHTNQDEPISGNFITAMAYNKVNNSIWAATWQAEGQTEYYAISASYNGGLSWQSFLPGEKAHNFGFKNEVLSGGLEVFDVLVPTDNGIYRSNNFGTTWLSPTDISDDRKLVSILNNEFYSAGVQQKDRKFIIWLGSAGEGLAKLEEENGLWSGDWTVYLASQPTAVLTETYAFPNPFSPDNEYTRIKYQLGSTPSGVTIRIMDFGMNMVKTLIQNVQRNADTEYFEFWNGKDENGSVVSNGVYFYRIDFDSGDPVFGKIMVLR